MAVFLMDIHKLRKLRFKAEFGKKFSSKKRKALIPFKYNDKGSMAIIVKIKL
jgi:hypothetical protein